MSEAFTSAASTPPASSCPKCGAAIPPEAPQGLCPKCLLKQASFPTETGPTTRHTRPAPPDRDELTRAFPHLEILELIGQGGMGFVYKARQPKLDRLVALKILAQPLAEQTHFAERFTREGRTLAKLNHPNIVTIHDFGQAGPFFYLLMEYVDGVNLRQAMRAGAVNSTQALAIVPRICEALQYAHNEGVLHRDIKPDNILLDTRGRVKIADFGIAKLMAEAVAENPLTGSGASLGTPHYMAPEQIEKPNAVDHRADIYSLGVVFYEMLTGELPLGRFAAPSEKSAIDPRLDEVVFQTLEKQPERRPQSADEVKTKVETIASDPNARPATAEPQPVTFKMSRCYISTPEFLRTWIGRFFRYTGAGELRLDEENLTFSPRRGNWIVMPLRSITNLSICDLPGWARRFGRGLKLISITFTEKSQTHRLFFIPNKGGFSPIWETNRHVGEWFAAIRNAIKAKTGRVPPDSEHEDAPSVRVAPRTIVQTILKAVALTCGVLVLLTVVAVLMYMALQKPQPPLPPLAPKPPRRAMNVVSVSGARNIQSIILRAQPEAAAGESFVPVIRYGNGPWSQGGPAVKSTETVTDETGLHQIGLYYWHVPSEFSSEFEIASAVAQVRARTERGPLRISTDPTVIFTITNQAGQAVSAGLRLEISSVPKQTNHSMAKVKDNSEHELAQLAESAPERTAATSSGPSPVKELPLRFKTVFSPNTLFFEAPVDLAFNEGIRTMIRYNDGKWDDNNYAAEYKITGGSQASRSLSLSWPLPENFSFPFDVKPVLDEVFGDEKQKLVRISTNQVLELFSITNALRQRISCGLQYSRLAPAASNVAIITNTTMGSSSSGIRFQIYGLAPANTSLRPVATFGTNDWFGTSLARRDFQNAAVQFSLPPEFQKLPPTGFLYQTVITINRGKRAEVFSLTNSDNKVFRAFLELNDLTK